MKFQSMVAIYALFWVMSAFVVLPFGVRTHEEAGAERVPGQAESAPYDFRPKTVLLRITVVSGALFALFLANWEFGWVTADTFGIHL